MVALLPHRATAGRPYRWRPCDNTVKRFRVRSAEKVRPFDFVKALAMTRYEGSPKGPQEDMAFFLECRVGIAHHYCPQTTLSVSYTDPAQAIG